MSGIFVLIYEVFCPHASFLLVLKSFEILKLGFELLYCVFGCFGFALCRNVSLCSRSGNLILYL